MVIHKSSDFLFSLFFGWRLCSILTIPNIFKALCVRDLISPSKSIRFSSLFNLVITWGRYPTPHVGMHNRVNNLEVVTLINVNVSVNFIHSPSFQTWSHSHVAWVFAYSMGLCSSNCPTHKGGVYLSPHTHKTKTKRTIKI